MYLSPTYRLKAMFVNKTLCEEFGYRHRRTIDPHVYHDIFDGMHYKELVTKNVVWEAQMFPDKYFACETDIALGAMTDGVPCFKRNGLDCNRDRSVKRLFDIDSFLQPLVDDLRILAVDGVSAERWIYDEASRTDVMTNFRLKAHLLTFTGDMPAVAKMNAIQHRAGKAHYYMARRSPEDDGPIDYATLPMRSHRQVMEQAFEIEMARSAAAKKRLGTRCGVNGQSLISVIGSVSFPWSFPLDIMHVLYENLMKELLGLWKGSYKASMMTGESTLEEEYVFSEHQWKLIDAEVARSTKLVPAQMAPSLSSVSERGYWNADTYAYFMMYLGPIVMRNRLPSRYYRHFVDLARTRPTHHAHGDHCCESHQT
ncbi:hypothetical protein QFC20_006531 [Naganishia adeliensis]|uniref:Uncharacterized protein n=1 Tax=Naganishia adeliensis TaxID=92952 RepID=A0ACC2V9Z6_9TREE|nr:hypothetical protein QFC20_006531 [Naganishia adeliensis]